MVLLQTAQLHALRILQFADFHFDADYARDGDPARMCHVPEQSTTTTNTLTGQQLGPFGDYKCDAPVALVTNAVRSAARLLPDPDLILWTGDNVPHIEGYDDKCE